MHKWWLGKLWGRRGGKMLGQAWDDPGPVAAATAEFGDTEELALCR